MTDPVEFKDEVDLPPTIIDDPEFPNGSIIKFERTEGKNEEVRIHLKIRDDNVMQILKVRTMVTRSADAIFYECPEFPLPTGAAMRDYDLVIPQSYLNPGECHKVQFAVSGHFTRCRSNDKNVNPEVVASVFDDVDTAHSDDLARATFWIWETGNNVLGNAKATQTLVQSCNAIEYNGVRPTSP